MSHTYEFEELIVNLEWIKSRMNENLDELLGAVEKKKSPSLVVRLSTSCWTSKRGIHMRRNIETLWRLSTRNAFDLLREDALMMDAAGVFDRITNLSECEDGVYIVVTCNGHKDWETGNIEDYDYKLLPYENHP